MGIAETTMKDRRNTKFSYFSDLSWFDGRGARTPYDPELKEVWPSDLPTRSDITKIDECKNIIAIFGDSFMYGHGVRKTKTIPHFINTNSKDTIGLSFGMPGASNDYTVKTLNQWTNNAYTEKTVAVVFNVAPLPRFDAVISEKYPGYINTGPNTFWPDLYDERYDYRCNVSSQNGGNLPDLKSTKDNKVRKTMQGMYDSYYRYWDTPVNQLINFEKYMLQMYWICRALDIPFYYIINQWVVSSFLNKSDMEWLTEKLNKLEKTSKMKRIDISDLDRDYDESKVYLKCGHWTPFSNKLIADRIYKEYLNDT